MGQYRRLVSTMMVCLLLLPYLAISAMAASEYSGTLSIREGDDHYWKVEGSGKLEFRVEVLSGGAVDVLVTDGPPSFMTLYYEGYKFTNEMVVEEKFTMQGEPAYLVVDNSDSVGVSPQGDVTVKVKWELTGQAWSLLIGILIPIIFVVLIVMRFALRYASRKSRTTNVDYQVENVYVDQQGRQIGSSMAMPAAAASAPTEPQWCPGCGAEMRWDPSQGRSICPYCRT